MRRAEAMLESRYTHVPPAELRMQYVHGWRYSEISSRHKGAHYGAAVSAGSSFRARSWAGMPAGAQRQQRSITALRVPNNKPTQHGSPIHNVKGPHPGRVRARGATLLADLRCQMAPAPELSQPPYVC